MMCSVNKNLVTFKDIVECPLNKCRDLVESKMIAVAGLEENSTTSSRLFDYFKQCRDTSALPIYITAHANSESAVVEMNKIIVELLLGKKRRFSCFSL